MTGWAASLRDVVADAGALAPLVFVVAYALLTVALVPGTPVTVVAGLLFGPVWGATLAIVGATLGAVGAFEVARRLGRARTARLLGPRLRRADGWLGEHGVIGVLALRLVPVLPFNLLNYAFGLSAVGRGPHALGTVVGIAPATVVFVVVGDAATDPTSPTFVLSLLAVALLLGGSALAARHRRARAASGAPPPDAAAPGTEGPPPATDRGSRP